MSTDRLRYLLDSYAGGSCTEEEIQELHELLKGDWASMQSGQQAPGVDWEKMYKELMVSIGGVEEVEGGERSERGERVEGGAPVRRLTNKWGYAAAKWWYAAAAVLVLAIGTAVVVSVTNHSKGKPVIATLNEVLPGGNKAILTLGNGQQIVLDSAHTGLLTLQGNARIIKTDSGTLAYTISNGKPTDVVYNMLTCPRGGQFKIRLPDGTDVWLNSVSSIRYPTAFPGRERKVEITGEAYFEVAREEAKPFVVEVSNMEVKVLGTSFNINSYEDEGPVRTTLLDGKIAVALPSDGQSKSGEFVVLKPGQQAVAASGLLTGGIDRETQHLTIVNDANVEQVMAWKNGFLSFKQADLTTVLRQLERWYDIDVKYAGNIPVRHFTGELSRDLTLSQVISVLSEMDVKFKIEGKTLTVRQ
jgi:transmembrane sensor